MKKVFLIGLTAASILTACSNDTAVDAPDGAAIEFTNTFVNKARKNGVINTQNISDFGVYGYIQEMTGVVFDNEKVYGGPSDWKYDNTQYWSANKQYWFAAVAPYSSAALFTAPDVMPSGSASATSEWGSIGGFVNDGSVDLLFAQARVQGKANGNTPVAFTFNHLLSKVKFTFTNGWSNVNTTLVISNLQLSQVYRKGDAMLTSAGTTWTPEDNTLTLNFPTSGEPIATLIENPEAKEESGVNFLIPATAAYTVTFDLSWYNGDVLSRVYHKSLQLPSTAMVPGYGYNFTAELTKENVADDLEPITFTVTEVKDWDEQPLIPLQ